MGKVDAILVGFNEVDFAKLAQDQKVFAAGSGAYGELKSNSVLLHGQRATYTQLLNHLLAESSGQPSRLNAFGMPNLACAYLASFLANRGFATEIVNFFNHDQQKLIGLLGDDPRAVVITTTYYVSDEPILEIVGFVRQHCPKVPIIIGGPHIYNICTVNSDQHRDLMLLALGADIYICDSQGEGSLARVLESLRDGAAEDLAEIPNLLVVESGQRIRQTLRVVESNRLDENPIDWSHFSPEFFAPVTYMRTARSCAFKCSFCDFPAFAGAHQVTDLEVVEKELRYLVEHGVEYILFTDDTFNVPLPRFKALCRMLIRNNFGLRWVSFFRPSNADEETFDLVRESGCCGLFLGIESGDQAILDNMEKHASLEKCRRAAWAFHERGIPTLASVIVGFPGETERSVRNTIDFLQETPFTFYSAQLYYHNSMAPIEQRRDEFGIVGSRYAWSHDSMDWREATQWKERLIREVDQPVLLPLFDLSIWSLPYFFTAGFSLEQIIDFARDAKKLLLLSLDDDPSVDFSSEFDVMADRMNGWTPQRLTK